MSSLDTVAIVISIIAFSIVLIAIAIKNIDDDLVKTFCLSIVFFIVFFAVLISILERINFIP